MKARLIATLLVATLILATAPAVTAQEAHKDPASNGTTGLFTVPVAAVLGDGEFSVAAFYATAPLQPGDTSMEYSGIAGSFAFAAAPGLEVYGMFEPRIGIHRNFTVQKAANIPTSYAPRLDDDPFAVDRWQTGIGDLFLGVKYKLMGNLEEYSGVAAYGEIKLPTSDTDSGIGTGKVDFSVGVIASAEAGEMVGVSGFVGGTFRSSPSEIELGNKLDLGVGVQVPTRFWLSGIAEFKGSVVSQPVTATPYDPENPAVAGYDPVYLLAGLRVSTDIGLTGDAAYIYNLNVDEPSGLELRKDGFLLKASYTNSRREQVVYVGAPPMDLPPVNRPPTLSCRAERTSVRVGESVRLFADVNDPDGDAVTVTWNTQAGTISPRQGETVTWSSQGVRPGSGPVVAEASDGYGGTADCQLTLTVNEPPPPPEPTILTFSCSEFPSGNTRIDNRCKAILDDVALQMRQNPRATAVITGHSDSAGSDEVNNRMSMERADNAEAYLVETHGIGGDRIDTASAGSSQPVGDNSTAEGRLQNRRIVVVVTIPAQ
ncbi:MAG: OmpA family protein [Acidobacteriota bacterium]